MKKYWLCIMLATMFCMIAQCFCAMAAETVDSGACGDNLTWVLSDEGVLTISGTGNMNDYDTSPWYGDENIITVVIDEGVTSIGDYSFEYCIGLTTVIISDSVTDIGDSAFSSCISLISVTIPDSVTSIGSYAFSGCSSLVSVQLSEEISALSDGLFSNCSALIEVEIPSGVTEVGTDTFYSCESLVSVEIPATVNVIEDHFSNCYSLTSLRFLGDLPDELNGEIFSTNQKLIVYCEPEYFTNFMQLMDWTINQATYYHANTFTLCSGNSPASLSESSVTIMSGSTAILVADVDGSTSGLSTQWYSANTDVVIVDNEGNITQVGHGSTVVYALVTNGTEQTVVTCMVYSQKASDLISLLPKEGVTADFPVTCDTSMYDASGILTGYQPAKYVEEDTSNETYQELFSITESITDDCTSDYEKAKAIQEWVSSELTYGGSLAIGDQISQIYATYEAKQSRCEGYSKLTGFMLYLAGIPNAIVVSDSIGHMWNMALVDGEWIMVDSTFGEFDFDVDDESHGYINHIAFGQDNMCLVINDVSGVKLAGVGSHILNRENVESVSVPDYVVAILELSMGYCENLKEVSLPSGITSIPMDTFIDCESLIELTIPDGVTCIGDDAFSGCTSLTSITIPDSVTSIGETPFYGCTSLEDIYITDLAAWVTIDFEYASSNPLTHAKSLYLNGELLTDVVIPDGVTSIHDYAFYDYTSLTSVEIPNSVTTIGNCAFDNCTNLTSVIIGNNVMIIGSCAFDYCISLASIEIPDSVVNIGREAFVLCTSLATVKFWGDAPEIETDAFSGVDATAYYPEDNSTWTEDLKKKYGGKITWVAYKTNNLEALGDVNLDGSIDYLDAMMVLRFDAELIDLSDDQLLAGDVNGDGSVDSLDAILILRYDAGLITSFIVV